MIGTNQEIFDEYKKNAICIKSYCYSEDQNVQNRQHMEDKHYINDNIFDNGTVGFYSVFDGHGGKDVVTYCTNNIPILFKQQYQPNQDIKQLFTQIFKQIDSDLKLKLPQSEEQGTCCCIVLVIKNKCYVINLGDTRAVICENGLSRRVSNDHKTKDEGEIKRIREAGGVIMRGRVSGTLAVTRALGDLTLKNEGVINVPDVFEFEINKNTQYMVIASDGLWDVCQDEEAIEMTKNMKSAVQQAHFLKDFALKNGTLDNTSVLVIQF